MKQITKKRIRKGEVNNKYDALKKDYEEYSEEAGAVASPWISSEVKKTANKSKDHERWFERQECGDGIFFMVLKERCEASCARINKRGTETRPLFLNMLEKHEHRTKDNISEAEWAPMPRSLVIDSVGRDSDLGSVFSFTCDARATKIQKWSVLYQSERDASLKRQGTEAHDEHFR